MNIITQNGEIAILEFLKELDERNSYNDFYAITFHMSKLHERNKSDYQLKIAQNILADLTKRIISRIFVKANKDIVIIFEAKNREFVEKIIYQLRYLFIDDPLAFKKPNIENHDFSTVYVLIFQKEEFKRIILNSLNDEQKKSLSQNFRSNQMQHSGSNTTYFQKIEEDIAKLDMQKLIRKRKAAIAIREKKLNPIFDELYVNIPNLRDLLSYDLSLFDNKILYHFLVKTIESKILETIAGNIQFYITGATNINLNVDLILSEKFVEFHKSLRAYTNNSLIIDINLSDAFNDITSFLYAKNFLHELGYKTCIDDIDHYSISQINRETLGVDLFKMSLDSDEELGEIEQSILKQYVSKCNPNRLIITHCNDIEIFNYGKAVGAYIFQGWLIDKRLKEMDMIHENI